MLFSSLVIASLGAIRPMAPLSYGPTLHFRVEEAGGGKLSTLSLHHLMNGVWNTSVLSMLVSELSQLEEEPALLVSMFRDL